MALESITTAPSLSDYTSLSDHQSETPGTFFGGKPVLYLHSANATLQIGRKRISEQSSFTPFSPAVTNSDTSAATSTSNGNGSTEPEYANSASPIDEQAFVPGTEVYVTSHTLVLWNPKAAHGLQIPYPAICMHAVNAGQVYIQLVLMPDDGAEDAVVDADAQDIDSDAPQDVEVLEFHILPRTLQQQQDGAEKDAETDKTPAPAPADALYDAIAKCSALNPDPMDEEADDAEDRFAFGGAGDEEPGAGGWITAENMDQFVDQDGNFKMPEGDGIEVIGDDGPGEADDEVGDEGHANKWRRTE